MSIFDCTQIHKSIISSLHIIVALIFDKYPTIDSRILDSQTQQESQTTKSISIFAPDTDSASKEKLVGLTFAGCLT